MLEAAVEQRVREAADLDWKGALISADETAGGTGRQKELEERRKEFAKDVAAMANTQGGLIVYGVSEVNKEAKDIVAVSLGGERDRQRLRSWANMIRPWLPDLVIEEFTEGDGQSQGILVVSIPASSVAPHIVGDRNEMGVPYRDGSHTVWMSEYQVERAYRDRFARRVSDEAAMDAQLAEVRDQVELARRGAWLVVAARPSTAPTQLATSRPGKEIVKETATQALTLAGQIQSSNAGRYPLLNELGEHAVNNPRVGLRRWVVTDRALGSAAALSRNIHVELHHDAASTVAFGIERRDGNNEPYRRVAVPLVGSAIVDAVALAATHSRSRGYAGALMIKAELVGGDDMPFGAVNRRNLGGFCRAN